VPIELSAMNEPTGRLVDDQQVVILMKDVYHAGSAIRRKLRILKNCQGKRS
jgi:hypothetical protein